MKYLKISQENEVYPLNLKAILGAPEKLFVWGNFKKEDVLAVAIVGARKASPRGLKHAQEFSCFLAGRGLTIVSGLARGIDATAHRAALKVKGRTVAVLGSGLDCIYPPEHARLANEIARNGVVVSEFSPKTPPLAKNFLERNRIITGLSLAILVVEGKSRSGTLSTAAHAARQGRDVFALPGSAATNFLINEGAKVAKTPKYILECLSHELTYR